MQLCLTCVFTRLHTLAFGVLILMCDALFKYFIISILISSTVNILLLMLNPRFHYLNNCSLIVLWINLLNFFYKIVVWALNLKLVYSQFPQTTSWLRWRWRWYTGHCTFCNWWSLTFTSNCCWSLFLQQEKEESQVENLNLLSSLLQKITFGVAVLQVTLQVGFKPSCLCSTACSVTAATA